MKIRGKAMWASLQAPNIKFEPVYQIDLIIEDSQVAGAKKAGLKVKKTDDGNIVRFRRNEKRKDGTLNKKPVVVDALNRPMMDLIGNGSIVNVQFSIYEYNNSFGKGTGADLQGVQVLELVEFGVPDGGEFGVEGDVVGDAMADNSVAEAVDTKVPNTTDDFDDDLPDVL